MCVHLRTDVGIEQFGWLVLCTVGTVVIFIKIHSLSGSRCLGQGRCIGKFILELPWGFLLEGVFRRGKWYEGLRGWGCSVGMWVEWLGVSTRCDCHVEDKLQALVIMRDGNGNEGR